MDIKSIIKQSGMTLKELEAFLHIPIRTLYHWQLGDRSCPDWTAELIEYRLKKEEKWVTKK